MMQILPFLALLQATGEFSTATFSPRQIRDPASVSCSLPQILCPEIEMAAKRLPVGVQTSNLHDYVCLDSSFTRAGHF